VSKFSDARLHRVSGDRIRDSSRSPQTAGSDSARWDKQVSLIEHDPLQATADPRPRGTPSSSNCDAPFRNKQGGRGEHRTAIVRPGQVCNGAWLITKPDSVDCIDDCPESIAWIS